MDENDDGGAETSEVDGGGADGGRLGVRADQLYTSGSRIKVKYFVGEDGSKQQMGLFDSQLNIACYYQMAADGVPRCLPAAELVGSASLFADSQCSRDVFFRTANSLCPQPVPTYIIEAPLACALGTRVRRAGPRVTTALYARVALDGGCAATTRSDSLEYFEGGTLITPSTFMRATQTTE